MVKAFPRHEEDPGSIHYIGTMYEAHFGYYGNAAKCC